VFSYVHNVPPFSLMFPTYTSTLFTHETIALKILHCISKSMHDLTCSQEFLEIQSFSTRQKSYWCLSKQTNSRNSSDVLKGNHTPRKLEEQPKHHKMTPKLIYNWMNNEKSFSIFAWKQGLPILNACVWNEKRSSLIILSQG
jgi:hypothetical protein